MTPLDHLSWPTVAGKRCLVVEPPGAGLEALWHDRGAAEVTAAAVSEVLGTAGRFDVVGVVAATVATPCAERVYRDAAARTHGVLVSVEPIAAWSSIRHRGRPRAACAGRATVNAAEHRRLLIESGLAIERVAGPFLDRDAAGGDDPATLGGPVATAVERAATAVLCRTTTPGVAYRVLLARKRS